MTDSAASAEASPPRTGWGWMLAAGIVLLVGGFIALLQPFATGLLTVAMVGAAMVAGGAFAAAVGIADRCGGDRWLYVLLGLAALALGILVLLYPFVAAASLVWAAGAWLLAAGLLQLVAGVRRRGRFWLILLGAVDILLGALLLIMDPISALFFLAVAVGFTFAFHGAAMVALALRLRPARTG